MRRALCIHMPFLPTDRASRDATPPADDSAGPAPQSSRTGAATYNDTSAEAARSIAVAPLVLTRRVGSSVLVEHCCPRAGCLGLRAGMSLGQAQAIAPQLRAVTHEPAHDRALLHRLASWALRFSPLVEPLEPNTLLIDITGCARLFGDEANIARQAVDGLTQQRIWARAAVADTVGGAYALAAFGDQSVIVAPPGQTSACIAPLPPAALRIDSKTCQQLDALGIRSIGDLLMLPRSSLPARFGNQLVRRLQQALGETHEGVAAHRPDEPPSARIVFEDPLSDPATIQSITGDLLQEMLAEVLTRERALRRIECIFYHERRTPTTLSIGLSRASRARRHLADLLARRLEAVDFSAGVCGITLIARETSPWNAAQGDLFDPRPLGDDEALGCLIDRIANRLGHNAIVRPRLIDDHQPEMAFRYVPVAEAGCVPDLETDYVSDVEANCVMEDVEQTRRNVEEVKSQILNLRFEIPNLKSEIPNLKSEIPNLKFRIQNPKSAIQNPQSKIQPSPPSPPSVPHTPSPHTPTPCTPSPRIPPRPLQLFARPLPIRVIALVPDGPPAWMSARGREYKLRSAYGPERIETAWWRGGDVRRDYFRVAAETGEQFWIFRALNDGHWYLHGIFT